MNRNQFAIGKPGRPGRPGRIGAALLLLAVAIALFGSLERPVEATLKLNRLHRHAGKVSKCRDCHHMGMKIKNCYKCHKSEDRQVYKMEDLPPRLKAMHLKCAKCHAKNNMKLGREDLYRHIKPESECRDCHRERK